MLSAFSIGTRCSPGKTGGRDAQSVLITPLGYGMEISVITRPTIRVRLYPSRTRATSVVSRARGYWFRTMMRDWGRCVSKTALINLHVRSRIRACSPLLVALDDDDGLVVNAVLLATLAQLVVPF